MSITNVIRVAVLASMVLLMVACTSRATDTATPQPTATSTPTVVLGPPTPTATATATATPQPTATSTPVPTATATPQPTATPTPTATATPTATIPIPTATPTQTPVKLPTPTPTRVASDDPNAFPPYPNIYSGNLVIGGKPAADGMLLFARVGGYQTPNVESKDGRYEVVVGPPDRSYFGRTITFYILIGETEAMAPQSGVFREVQFGSPPQYLHNSLDLVYQ